MKILPGTSWSSAEKNKLMPSLWAEIKLISVIVEFVFILKDHGGFFFSWYPNTPTLSITATIWTTLNVPVINKCPDIFFLSCKAYSNVRWSDVKQTSNQSDSSDFFELSKLLIRSIILLINWSYTRLHVCLEIERIRNQCDLWLIIWSIKLIEQPFEQQSNFNW